jgi:hypothetical protein
MMGARTTSGNLLYKGRFLLPLGLVLALPRCSSCDDPLLRPVQSGLQVDPPVLDLGRVVQTTRGAGQVILRNNGEGPVSVTDIAFDGMIGFETRTTSRPFVLASGQSVTIDVTIQPSEAKLYQDTLRIESNASVTPRIDVPVRVVATPIPDCNDGNECTEDRFDPESGACQNPFADGHACESKDRCIVDSVCDRGVCLGTGIVCEDVSPCTQELCRQSDGECISIPDPAGCDDNNPCTTDTCGSSGCEHRAAPSGTPCNDENACSIGDSCFGGACVGSLLGEGRPCDDGNSCTRDDICESGLCAGTSIIESADEGQLVFTFPLTNWPVAFLHRREVSLDDSGTLYALDHLQLPDDGGLSHIAMAMRQCGSTVYNFSYRPPDSLVLVRYVRREMQLSSNNELRIVVGVRQLLEDGFRPETTTFLLDRRGTPILSTIRTLGGETGRSLLPDGSNVHGVIFPTSPLPPTETNPAQQNLLVVREDRFGDVLWRYERESGEWSEFLGVAGPRVLFWANGRFGALDFNTGATVWSVATPFIAKEMALSTSLNLGAARAADQIIGVEILSGAEVFRFPPQFDPDYVPRTDPIISADGRIMFLMQRNVGSIPQGLEWIELDARGQLQTQTTLPYVFPIPFELSLNEDRDDPYPTVAKDGISYIGYGDRFFAINPGGAIRWTRTSTVPSAFTGSVPLLRSDGILLINEESRRIIGIRTNDATMSSEGWASFRHDGRRTNFTP